MKCEIIKFKGAVAGAVSKSTPPNLSLSSLWKFAFLLFAVLLSYTPSSAQTTTSPAGVNADATQEIIGKRVVFSDGQTLEVDDAWKSGDAVWIKRNGTSQMLNRAVKRIEDRFKTATPETKQPIAEPAKTIAAPESPQTWIYLNNGARLRVDEVREVSDGAWYNRDKVTIFLARDRIARIERIDPGAVTEDWKEHDWSSGSPEIDQLINKNASRFGVDPYLVFLVIEQESQFRPRARSHKGAQGLMQLMPGTARRFGVYRPYDPAENIRGGTQYLKYLLTMFDGKVDLALASYNAGEGRVLDYGHRVPPFKETRNYVKRISARYKNQKAPSTTKTTVSKPRQ